MSQNENWIRVCQLDDLVKNSGVCALVEEQQVALFKIDTQTESEIFAITNWDPIGKAQVLYRGIIGSIEEDIVVASPLYKQRFSLVTGKSYDAEISPLTVYPVKVTENDVFIAAQS
jgi:nitrite reductase (NADH) small subunit